jgi:N-acetylglucosamine kinase-like BadF-type ATPase
LTATGTLYFKTTGLALTGNVSSGKMAIVADTLSIVGSSTFQQDLTGAYTGLATSNPGIIQ